MSPLPRLVLPACDDASWPQLDEGQLRAVEHRGGRALVLGAPGTGKTTVAAAAVLSRIRQGIAPERTLVLSGSRVAAAKLRSRLSAAIGATVTEPLSRTVSSVAFGLLRLQAQRDGRPVPRLLSGPEQDAILRELLAGHAAGVGDDLGWPEELAQALTTRGFRAELRDLLMRAAEQGLSPAGLAMVGQRAGRPEWVAAARLAAEYEQVSALSAPGGFDPAVLLVAAAEAVEDDPGLLREALPGLAVVVVDDAQDLTPPGARLIDALVGDGTDLLLVGDPDSGTQAFRGGDPTLFAELARGGPTYLLPSGYRQGSALAEVRGRVAARIGTAVSTAHRRPEAGTTPARTSVILARSATQEARHVAEYLRRAHLLHGTPWSGMAVIVRGAARTATLRRVLTGDRIPVDLPGAQVPLRDEPVVAALLELLRISLDLACGRDDPLTGQGALDLLASPVGGMDPVGLRRLQRAVRSTERVDGTGRPTLQALSAGLLTGDTVARWGADGGAARRIARAIAAGRQAAAREDGRWSAQVTAETVLWAIWAALGVADSWRATALAGGPAGARADRELDAVVALFEVAATYTDRLPGRGPDGFLDHLQGQDLAGDMLVDRAPIGDAVTITTPAGAAGREWDVVAVCGVQEGVWPDLRLRGSVLGSSHLVEVLSGRETGPREALAAVRHDETRLFHVAVSRASRELLVTAVRNDEEQPSSFVDLVDPLPPGIEERPVTPVDERMSQAGVVARLRRELASPDRTEAEVVAVSHRLLLLAEEGIVGADPEQWWPLTELSDVRPRRGEDVRVRVSPSQVERFEECELRWLLSTCGGDRPRTGGADAVGSLVHAIAAECDELDLKAMHAELHRRWPELGMPPGWLSERSRVAAETALERFAQYAQQSKCDGWTVLGREVAGTAAVGRADISGRVDRLEADQEGRLRVVDLKTSTRKRPKADLDRLPQLGIYQLLVEEGAFESLRGDAAEQPATPETPETPDQGQAVSAGAALLQVGFVGTSRKADLQVQPPLRDNDDPQWAEDLLDRTAEGMAGATYTARTGQWCRTCSSRSCCPLSGEGEVI